MRKSDDARRLLRTMNDIDDRFLTEAMMSGKQETGECCALPKCLDGAVPDKDGRGTGVLQDCRRETARPGSSGRRHRYAAVLLTSAACLTVLITGTRIIQVRTAPERQETGYTQETAVRGDAGDISGKDKALDFSAAGRAVADSEVPDSVSSGETVPDTALMASSSYQAAVSAEDGASPESGTDSGIIGNEGLKNTIRLIRKAWDRVLDILRLFLGEIKKTD